MRNYETGLDYANNDPSLHFNTLPRGHRGPTWQSVWIYLLKAGDEESAQLVRDQNPTLSHECEGGAHDDCHYPHCECPHHRAIVLKSQGKPVQSCTHLQIERDEQEAA